LNNIGEFIAGYDGVIITAALDDFSNSSEKTLFQENTKSKDYSKKIIYPTSKELEDHKNFLKKDLKKNFF